MLKESKILNDKITTVSGIMLEQLLSLVSIHYLLSAIKHWKSITRPPTEQRLPTHEEELSGVKKDIQTKEFIINSKLSHIISGFSNLFDQFNLLSC